MRNIPNVRPCLFTKVAFLLTATLALSAVAVPAAAEPMGCDSDTPAISGPMSIYLVEGQPVADHSFSTGCAEATTWAVVGDLPPGIAFDAMPARFTGTPTTDAGGSFEITATDSRGTGLFEGSFEVINPELSLSGSDGSPIDLMDLDRGSALEVGGFAPDGATVDVLWSGVSLGSNPAAGSFTRELTVPANAAPGTHVVGVTIGFSNGQSYSFGFDVSVSVLELTGPTSVFPIVGTEVTYRYSALGAGADAAYTLAGALPYGMAFDSSAVTISGTPEGVGTYNLSLSVGDGARTDTVDIAIEVVAAAAVRPPIHLYPPSAFFQKPGVLGQIGGLDPDDAGSIDDLDDLIDRHNSAVNNGGTPQLPIGADPQTGGPRFFIGSEAESAREQNRLLEEEAKRQAERAQQERLKALEQERQKREDARKTAEELLKAKTDQLKEQLEKQKRANEEAAEAARKRAEEEYLKRLNNEAAQRLLEKRQAALNSRTEPNPLPAGTSVRLELHSTPVLLAQATVGPSGGFLIRASVPTGTPPGLHHLVVTYTLPDGTVYTQAMAVNVFDPNLLAPTGADVAPLGYAASAFLLVGLAAILVRRRLST